MFVLSIDEGYCKPIITNYAFNNNYVEYRNKGDKGKTLSIKDYLYMIISYLTDMINNIDSTIIEKLIQVIR